ncbi:MAG: TonB-dependent receptor, partial [Methylococcaceae bacterium]|nr:TonB-dependent receptor [Methylococcaceae bacterium]
MAIAGASMMTALNVEAATPKKKTKSKAVSTKPVSELELENQQLRQELAAAKQRELELIKKGTAGTVAAGGSAGQAVSEVAANDAAPLELPEEKDESQNKDLGEVVVKAKPKLAKLHDVAQSVSVVSGQELSRELSRDLGDITRRASNVQFNQNNTRGASLSIRGLGKRSFSETQDPSVGVTVDGVPYALSQLANFSFYDVESVEVTRGPRGTEGGLAASSGKVNVASKAPSFTPTAELSATYGQQEALILQGTLGGAVIDNLLAWRGSFIVDRARGFYEQEYDRNFSLYNRDRLSGRAQLLFTPTSNLTARIIADFEPKKPQLQNGLTFYHGQPFKFADGSLTDRNGTSAMSKLNGYFSHSNQFALTDTTSPGAISAVARRAYFDNRGFTYADYVGGEQRGTVWFDQNKGQTVNNQGAAALIDWEVGNHVLSSRTGVREYRFDAHNDEGTPFDISVDGGGGVKYNQWTQEFKIANKQGGFLDYKAGVIGLFTKDDIASKSGWGADAGAWFATNGQYDKLYRSAGVNQGAGQAILKDVLQDARALEVTEVRTQSGALFGEADLHFTDDFTITAGLRTTHEDRKSRNTRGIARNGAGGAFNSASAQGVATGGFNSDINQNFTVDQNGDGILDKNPDGSNKTITNPFYGSTTTQGKLNATQTAVIAGDPIVNTAQQTALANSVATRYFGAANYGALTAAQQTMIANAKTLRAAQLGRLNSTFEDDYRDVLYTAQLTPSYKINDDLTAYLAWQYGEKSGSAAPVNGRPFTVKPEETHALELGLKSFWVDKSVVVNLDAFVMDIKNYQQAVQVVDEFQTEVNLAPGGSGLTAYTSTQGNVGHVRVHGVELDSVINTVPNLSIRFNGAYNVAEYLDYKNAPKPEELGYLKANYIDQTGQLLPGASLWNFNVGAEYSRPIFDSKFIAHTSFNTAYQTNFNNTDNLSSYGQLNDRARTDAAIGIGSRDKVWDLSLIGKN